MIGQRELTTRAGVTLLETVMVVVLLAAAAVASGFVLDRQWVSQRQVSAATNDVAQTLVVARNTAITHQATVSVRRGRTAGVDQLRVTQQAGPYSPPSVRTFSLDPETRLSGSPREIRFTPSGNTNRGLNWNIRQSGTSGEVSVSPTDGHVNRILP